MWTKPGYHPDRRAPAEAAARGPKSAGLARRRPHPAVDRRRAGAAGADPDRRGVVARHHRQAAQAPRLSPPHPEPTPCPPGRRPAGRPGPRPTR